MKLRAVILLPGLLLQLGCSVQELAVNAMVPVFAETRDDMNRTPELEYAREAGPGLLVLLDGLAKASPRNAELRILQAEMHASFAFAFLEEEKKESRATMHYRRAQQAALAAVGEEDTGLAGDLEGLSAKELSVRLKSLSQDALAAVFWWAFSRGAEINLGRDKPELLEQIDRVDVAMQWVLNRDETFFNGGAHVYFAMRHASLSEALGGDPAKSRKHFRAVDRITRERHLMAKVLWAEHYAPNLAATPPGASEEQLMSAEKRAWMSFYQTLKGVLDAPEDLWPEMALSNAVARRRARALLQDPEAHGVIQPESATNPYAEEQEEDEAWEEESGGGEWDEGE